jgi:hypothetical protein
MPHADTLHAAMIARFGVRVGFPLDACLLARLLLPARHARDLPDALDRLGIGGWQDTRSDGVGKVGPVESARLRMAACADVRALVKLWERVAPLLAVLPDEAPAIALQSRICIDRPLQIDADAVAQGLAALADGDGSVDADRAQHLRRLLLELQARSRSVGCLHSHFDYLRTAPGRFAAEGNLNLQTLPVPDRYPEGPLRAAAQYLRRSLSCPEGYCLVCADAAQIEPRIAGAITGQCELHDIPAAGGDVYRYTAEHLSRAVPECAEAMAAAGRALAKQSVLALTFGLGPEKYFTRLQDEPACSAAIRAGQLDQARTGRLHRAFHDRYPEIRRSWSRLRCAALQAVALGEGRDDVIALFCRNGALAVQLPSERCIRFADVRMGHDKYGNACALSGKDALHGAKLLQHVVTGIARDLMVHAMVQIEQAGYPVVGHIHDSLVCMVHVAQADQCAAALLQAWRTMPPWAPGLVLDAKVSVGRTLMFEGV